MAVNQIGFPQYQVNSLVDQGQWDRLAGLGDVYRAAEKRTKLEQLGKEIGSGNLTYQQAAGRIGELGDIPSALKFLGLAEARRKQDIELGGSADLNTYLTRGAGASSAAPSNTRVAAVEPDEPPAPPRVPVAEIPGVIRTNPDGSIAGNISDPSLPPQQPAPAMPQATPPMPQTAPAMPQARPPGAATGLPPQALPPNVATLPPGVAQANAAGGMSQEGPTMADVPHLMRMLPRLPESQQGVVAAAIKHAWDSAKPTAEIQTLNALRDDPQLFNLAKQFAEAKSQKINIHPGEKKQDELMGEELAKMHSGYIKDALKVPVNKATLEAAERAMTSKDFASGLFGPVTKAAQQALVGMGMADAATAAPNELFSKLQNKAIMDSGGTASGLGPQISNNDAKIIRDSTFNATNTPEGNRMIIGFQKLMEDRKVEYVREMNKYAKAHGGRIDIGVMEHMNDWAEKNPLDFAKVPGFTPPPDTDALEKEMRKRGKIP